jgi:hypothetical protein
MGLKSMSQVPLGTQLPPKPPKALDDIMGDMGDVMGLPRPTSWWRGHNPPGSKPARLPLVKHPPLSGAIL